jgi:hypothetical protein
MVDVMGIYPAMTTGTAPPPTPSADLIDRFNAIIDDVLACVAVESMKAAGVPWVLRMILAPLLRRRLARWSTAFSAVMADARAGRGIEPAKSRQIDQAGDDLAVQPDSEERPSRTIAAEQRARSATAPKEPAAARHAPEARPISSRCASDVMRTDHAGERPHVWAIPPIHRTGDAVGAGRRSIAPPTSRFDGTDPPCEFLQRPGEVSSHGQFVTIT